MLKKLVGILSVIFVIFVSGCSTKPETATTTTTTPVTIPLPLETETTTSTITLITTPTTIGTTPTTILKGFTIEADDSGFYPNGTITVNKGDRIRITFVVRTSGTYYGGLDFRSTVWGDTGTVKPGEAATVEFTANETFTFTSYWPVSNVAKATGQVTVI